ncbi:FKBP-type peptidyl-prolyl cis-trans isomerase [bacterium]|nr:FKBP-type peptidyl-prolyl cis-trans isomerase [bacterium]
MKKIVVIFLILALAAISGCGDKGGRNISSVETSQEKLSYSFGYQNGDYYKKMDIDLDPKIVAQGIIDAMTEEAEALLTDEEMQQVMQDFQNEMIKKQQEKMADNNVEGAAFLAENKTKPGVKTTASGLQYRVIEEGTGKKPTAANEVEVHYKGTLIDGTEFDSSYKRNETITFPLNGVIKGWTEGLQLMREGSKYEFVIPSDLAYGPRGSGGVIGPNAVLVFIVELISVK